MIDNEDLNGVIAGLNDAIVYVTGDKSRGRIVTFDVKAVRAKTEQFVRTYHIPTGTLQDWEQGMRRPDIGSVTLLRMIATDPKGVEKILAKVERDADRADRVSLA